MTAALHIEKLTVRYPGAARPALSDFSLTVAEGEAVALLGLNGSGKTTLLRAAAGLVPFEGTIRVGGLAVEPDSLEQTRARLGFVFSSPADQLLFPRVVDDVAFGLRRAGVSPQEATDRARATLEALGAGALAEQVVYRLSHGQQQRVAIAGATVTGPLLLLLDEPSAGLDPLGRRRLARLLKEQGAAMLLATHDLAFAAQVCGHFLILEDGRIAAQARELAAVEAWWQARAERD